MLASARYCESRTETTPSIAGTGISSSTEESLRTSQSMTMALVIVRSR